MLSSTIIGFYRCKDSNGNDLYVYVTKSPSGELNYNFTSDFDEASKIAAKFCNSKNKYTREDYKDILNDYPDSFNLNCKDVKEVLERIKRANPTEKIKEDEFDDAKDDFDEDEKGFFANIKEKISNSNIGTKVKNLWFNKKTRRIILGSVTALSVFGVTSFCLNKFSGPTADNSKIVTVDNTDNKDKTEEEDKTKDENKEETEKNEDTNKEDNKSTNTADNIDTSSTQTYTTSNSSTSASSDNSQSLSSGSSSSSGSTSSSGGSSSNHTTTTPGSVNNNISHSFQDPNVSLDDSNNQGSSSGGESEQPEDPYQNVGEEEIPVNDNNNGDTPSTDEGYSEEIDVSVDDDDELTEGNIVFDEGYENDGAVDNDYTYDINYDTDNSSDYEIINEELPDPNQTAADGNYVSSEEEMNNQEDTTNNNEQSTEVTDTSTTTETETVPVYQEETDYTETSVPITSAEETSNTTTPSTMESSGIDLETAADQAIAEMDAGNDVSIAYDTTTGQYNVEVTNADANTMEANGLTK